MSLRCAAVRVIDCGFPRVSGDEPLGFQINGRAVWFSPRERG